MVNPIDNGSSQVASASSSAGKSSGKSFAATLASAKKATAAAPASATDGTTTDTGTVDTTLKPPKGETWGPVAGHSDYADILSGPRNGYYVSLAPGKRQGKAFLIQHKDGKTYHVYGTGSKKEWVRVAPDPNSLTPPKGESWNSVGHHRDYKKIAGGQRNDMFMNLSGNDRTGEAFKIVERDGKTFHVYGSGKDVREVAVGGHSAKKTGS
jgi:hypothetical protein